MTCSICCLCVGAGYLNVVTLMKWTILDFLINIMFNMGIAFLKINCMVIPCRVFFDITLQHIFMDSNVSHVSLCYCPYLYYNTYYYRISYVIKSISCVIKALY